MPNKLYNKMTPGKGWDNEPAGSGPESSESREGITGPMPEKTANWPGLPGKASASRAAGTPQKGSMGPFVHKKIGM